MPHLALDDMIFVSSAASGGPRGHVALRLPLAFVVFHWGDLYRALRARVPDAVYRAGNAVHEVRGVGARKAAIRLADGDEQLFDVVVCADGYRSERRRALFPGQAGRAEAGSFLYPLPGPGGSVVRGERFVNWGCYVPMAAAEPVGFLVDGDGHAHQSSIPPGDMRTAEELRLKGVAREHLPPYYAGLVAASEGTSATLTHVLSPSRYQLLTTGSSRTHRCGGGMNGRAGSTRRGREATWRRKRVPRAR